MTHELGELLQDHEEHKWIAAPDEHADHPGQTLLTRDRAVIRAWALARHAEPATGIGKVDINDGGAAIRFAFPGVGRLQPISWDDWFRDFDEHHLVFAFEERTGEGLQSHKYRIVRPEDLPHDGADHPTAAGHWQTMKEASASPRGEGDDRPPQRGETGWRRALNVLGARIRRG